MATLELVVIGASAGGLEALVSLFSQLPKRVPAAFVVVVHTRSESNSCLPHILSRESQMPVQFAADGARIERGQIYVAPPDFHLLIADGHLRLSRGPKENGFRPAVDPLFRSAARAYGEGVMGIVLSGGLDDGSYGLLTIKEAGGITVAQDPEEARVESMPASAIRHVAPAHVLRAADIGILISRLSGTEVQGDGDTMARRTEPEPQDPATITEVDDMEGTYGAASGLTCPDCGGALWEIKNGNLARYRCHVGHQYTPDGLDVEQHEMVEGALWTAVRVLEEHAELRRRMASRAGNAGVNLVAQSFEASARDAHRQAAQIRALLFSRTAPEPSTAGAARPPRPSAAPVRKAATKRARKARSR